MLVEQSRGVLSPTTGGRFSPAHETTSPSSGASRSPSTATDSPHEDSSASTMSGCTPIKAMAKMEEPGDESLSPLQRLQFSMQQNTVFSKIFEHDIESTPGDEAHDDKEDSMNKTGDDDDGASFGSNVKSEFDTSLNGSANIFQCILCSVSCNNRHQFNEHMVSHSQQRACPKCSYLTNDDESLRNHLQEVHDLSDTEVQPDDEVRVPKVNSQGKLKTFKCKQCEYKAVTKMDFWEHTKSHIRTEKMLNCPKCPFVTEYKHHLEYHLRNHFGSKPFQCTKCSYSCVNKSMLNSHLKSHSSVYQYRCADCAYATKYCHSLKLHLRKYKHNPSMVLNLDGTPNPLPIIDVYGTRRGPKMKRPDPSSLNESVTDYNGNSSTSTNSNLVKAEIQEKLANSLHSNTQNKATPKASKAKRPAANNRRGKKFAGSGSDDFHTDESSQDMDKSYGQGIGQSPFYDSSPKVTPTFETFSPKSTHSEVADTGYKAAAAAAAAAAAVAGRDPMELYAAAVNQYLLNSNPWYQLTQMGPDLATIAKEQQILLTQIMNNQNQTNGVPDSLSNDNSIMRAKLNSYQPKQLSTSPPPLVDVSAAPLDLRNPKSSPSYESAMDCSTSRPSEKRKRKVKTNSRSNKMCTSLEVNDVALDFSKKTFSTPKLPSPSYLHQSPSEQKMCKYCEISFPDQLLYSMHMSYHSGGGDPFLCNSCGKRTQDKLSFFLHLTTAPH